jgi:uncharacterized LabA/DUF88 family protein
VRVGLYIDGFNLYYGGRAHCGQGTAGWRWLDVRSLATDLLGRRHAWTAAGAFIEKIVYCTARIDAVTNPVGQQEQDVYLKALRAGGSVDFIQYGHYVSRVKSAPLATRDPNGLPTITTPQWPVMVQDATGQPMNNARFMVSYAHREEKGSDVNVAMHLLLDTLQGNIDAAVVVSNDSDLRFPLQEARSRIPVGTVNPHRRLLAGALRGQAADGVGGHWWTQLQSTDFFNHQLPDPCEHYTKPPPW